MSEPSDVERLIHLVSEEFETVHQRALQLARSVDVVQSGPGSMRPAVLREAFEKLDDPMLLAVLTDVLKSARDGHQRCRMVAQELALAPELITAMPYERIQRLYELARATGLREVRAIFMSGRSRKGLPQSHTENDHLQLPLGLRRQAARGQDRQLLDRLVRDRNHRVIALLLDNPRIVERDVVTIAAGRPTTAAILRTVAEHRKWSSRYRIRKTLACNPYTPTPIAMNLLKTLMVQDLRFIKSTGVLKDTLLAEAERLLHAATRQPRVEH